MIEGDKARGRREYQKKSRIFALLMCLGGPTMAYDGTGETPPPDCFCYADERYLTDLEFLEKAFQFEKIERNLPEPLSSLDIAGLQELNPDCCYVQREDYELNQDHQTFWKKLLWREIVFVSIGWSTVLDTPWRDRSYTSYHMTNCGDVCSYTGRIPNSK